MMQSAMASSAQTPSSVAHENLLDLTAVGRSTLAS
jgi:hypothetical protein